MARTDNLDHFLTDVASAIKTKKGSQTAISASNFDTEIANLPSGGGISKANITFIVKDIDDNVLNINEINEIDFTLNDGSNYWDLYIIQPQTLNYQFIKGLTYSFDAIARKTEDGIDYYANGDGSTNNITITGDTTITIQLEDWNEE